MFASVFVLLYAAHLTADYALQTDHMAAHKANPGRTGWRANAEHAACHAVLSIALLWAGEFALGLSLGTVPVLAAVAWIAGSHSFIDRRWPVLWWMRRTGSAAFIEHGGAAHVDQAAHIVLGLLPAALLIAATS